MEVRADPTNVKRGGLKGGSQVVQLSFRQPNRISVASLFLQKLVLSHYFLLCASSAMHLRLVGIHGKYKTEQGDGAERRAPKRVEEASDDRPAAMKVSRAIDVEEAERGGAR